MFQSNYLWNTQICPEGNPDKSDFQPLIEGSVSNSSESDLEWNYTDNLLSYSRTNFLWHGEKHRMD